MELSLKAILLINIEDYIFYILKIDFILIKKINKINMSDKVCNVCTKNLKETIETISYNRRQISLNICNKCYNEFKLNLTKFDDLSYIINNYHQYTNFKFNDYRIDDYYKYIYFCNLWNLSKDFKCELCKNETYVLLSIRDYICAKCCLECYDKFKLWNDRRKKLLEGSDKFEKDFDFLFAKICQKASEEYTKMISKYLYN